MPPLSDYGPLSNYAPFRTMALSDYGLHRDYAPFRSMASTGTKQSLRRVNNR